MRVLGIDIGGTKLLARGLDPGGDATFRVRLATGRASSPEAVVAMVRDTADQARDALGGLDAIGIGFPGLVGVRGIVCSSTMLDGWHDVDLGSLVARATGVRCTIDNDVNAAAVYEHALRGASDFLHVAVGTGIGGALVLGGQVWRGAGGFAGELGHISIDRAGPPCRCGRRGCVHLYASGAAIDAALGRAPDAAHLPAVLDAAAALGIAIGSALNVVDVPLVVLGGGIAELGPAYVDAVAASARRECFAEIGRACAVEAALGGYDAAALGAALIARQSIGESRAPAGP